MLCTVWLQCQSQYYKTAGFFGIGGKDFCRFFAILLAGLGVSVRIVVRVGVSGRVSNKLVIVKG